MEAHFARAQAVYAFSTTYWRHFGSSDSQPASWLSTLSAQTDCANIALVMSPWILKGTHEVPEKRGEKQETALKNGVP